MKENRPEFTRYGKRAVIVTGKYSSRVSGALDDVIKVMDGQGIDYIIYDKVENNPCSIKKKQ